MRLYVSDDRLQIGMNRLSAEEKNALLVAYVRDSVHDGKVYRKFRGGLSTERLLNKAMYLS